MPDRIASIRPSVSGVAAKSFVMRVSVFMCFAPFRAWLLLRDHYTKIEAKYIYPECRYIECILVHYLTAFSAAASTLRDGKSISNPVAIYSHTDAKNPDGVAVGLTPAHSLNARPTAPHM